MSMTIRLSLKPLKNVSKNGDNGRWSVTGLPVRLELLPNYTALPTGWVLLRGVLHRWGQDFSARLVAIVEGEGEVRHSFPLSVTRKGSIRELICLPKGVSRLLLEPMRSLGEFELGELSLSPVGKVERFVRMCRRVIPLFFKQSRERRHKVGLHAYTPFINLDEAYRVAGRFKAYSPALSYGKWIEEFDTLSKEDRRLMRRQIKVWDRSPIFQIIVFVSEPPGSGLKRTFDSLHGQLYRHFQVTVLVGPNAVKSSEVSRLPRLVEVLNPGSEADVIAVANARLKSFGQSSWIVVLEAGTVLAENALYWLAFKSLYKASAGLIYTDHDFLNKDGERVEPVFKPDWSPELLRSTTYIGCSAIVRSEMLVRAGGFFLNDNQGLAWHDLFLRVSEQLDIEAIRHIPAVLWHLPIVEAGQDEHPDRQIANPVIAHLSRLGVAASVTPLITGHFRVRYELPANPPLVSIVVPTRNALAHLRACMESVLMKSSYDNFEVIVIDNQSSVPLVLDYLEKLTKRPRVRVFRYDKSFNYSAINNFAAGVANGEVLCLLNNDTEVITPGWLEEMLGHLVQPGVGVVGAKLFYGDGRVQHAGDTVGPGGCAHHLHALIERDAPGYCSRAILAQDLSAVTAACLMTWRWLFQDLNGLDAINLPVSYNDVDYCLRVREAGYRVLWTPYAELYHHESVSRGKDNSRERQERSRREAIYMRNRWKHVMRHDPFYNPNLSYQRPDFSLSNSPMVKKPWRD